MGKIFAQGKRALIYQNKSNSSKFPFLPQKFVKSNQTIQLKETVDPNIIGGLIASIGDKYVDMSVATKIKKYTDLIQSAA